MMLFDNYEHIEKIHDDKYCTPIQYLLEKVQPSSLEALQDTLDENGYYGRHECYHVRRLGRKTEEVVCRMFMPLSDLTYRFYPAFDYIMEDGIVYAKAGKKKVELSDKTLEAMGHFIRMWGAHPYTLSRKTGWSVKECQKLIDNLYSIGVVRGNALIISHPDDIEELYYNIINI